MTGPRRTINARLPVSTIDAVDDVLKKRKLQHNSLIESLYNLVKADPEGALALLRPHWPAPRPEGRPRKQAGTPPKT